MLLQLEITESMVMQNVERAIRLLDAIQSRGVRLAIDDFGTGYSSMSLMKQFPIDTIKIDRSFVRDLRDSSRRPRDREGHHQHGQGAGPDRGRRGRRDHRAGAFLRGHACDEIQGYLFSKPVPAANVPSLLRPVISSPPLQPSSLPSPQHLEGSDRQPKHAG